MRMMVVLMLMTVVSMSQLAHAQGKREPGFVPIAEAKLKRIDGYPTLHINGQPKPFIAWAQYDTYPNLVETATRTGIRIYQPRLIASFQTAEFIENQMKEVLAKDPNAYFLPSMWVGGDQIYGFDKRDSAEYNTDTAASWNAISFGSQEWVNRVELHLRQNIRRLENGKFAGHILGYMVLAGNTGEWFYVDTYTDRDFDFTLNGMSNLFDPTVGVQRLYWSKNFQPGVPFSNGAHYSNPKVDSLLEAAAVETDVQKRFALFSEFQKIIIEDLPDLGISTLVNPIVYDKRVNRFYVGAEGLGGNAAQIFIKS